VTNQLHNVVHLIRAKSTFAAFRAADGPVVAWGHIIVLGFTGGAVIAVDAVYANITQRALKAMSELHT
jgi:energy-converting hydrogenase Eha subunit G